MGSYQEADGIILSQLNNTEYTNFMSRTLVLLTTGSISKLTVTDIVNSIEYFFQASLMRHPDNLGISDSSPRTIGD